MATHPIISYIIPGLYLGAYQATSHENLVKHKITHIVNVSKDIKILKTPQVLSKNILQIKVDDVSTENLARHFALATKFIHTAITANKNNHVLVHCRMGVSRSATIVIAYLMTYKNMPLCQALQYVSACRAIICPNFGFYTQLYNYEKTLNL